MEYNEISDFEWHEAEFDHMIQQIESFGIDLPQNELWLDIGGGLGMHVGKMNSLAKKTYVFDQINYNSIHSGRFINSLHKKYVRNGRKLDLDKIEFHNVDAQNTIYRDNLFGVILSTNSFEHIPDPTRALQEVIRILKPGGIVHIVFDPIWTSPNGHHCFQFIDEPWAHLVYEDEEFIDKMLEKGASDSDINEYQFGMNRHPASYYFDLFSGPLLDYFSFWNLDSWVMNLSDEPATEHDNFRLLVERGFSPQELIVRGMRFIATKHLDT